MSQVTPTERQAIPALESMQNCTTRVVASTLGILAGLLGLIHPTRWATRLYTSGKEDLPVLRPFARLTVLVMRAIDDI